MPHPLPNLQEPGSTIPLCAREVGPPEHSLMIHILYTFYHHFLSHSFEQLAWSLGYFCMPEACERGMEEVKKEATRKPDEGEILYPGSRNNRTGVCHQLSGLTYSQEANGTEEPDSHGRFEARMGPLSGPGYIGRLAMTSLSHPHS